MFEFISSLLVLIIFCVRVESSCSDGCDALGSYYLWPDVNLTFISTVFSTSVSQIRSYNPQITNPDFIDRDTRINVPFSCGCVGGEFMGHQFDYQIRSGNYYQLIAERYYSNLTTVEMLRSFNSYDPDRLPDVNAILNVTVNCSCGNSRVSRDYGLFVTYPLRPGENLSSLASESQLPEELLRDYNPGSNFSSGSGLVFIPGRGESIILFSQEAIHSHNLNNLNQEH